MMPGMEAGQTLEASRRPLNLWRGEQNEGRVQVRTRTQRSGKQSEPATA